MKRKLRYNVRSGMVFLMIIALVIGTLPLSLWSFKSEAAGSKKEINMVTEANPTGYIKKGEYVRYGIDSTFDDGFDGYWIVMDNEHTNTGSKGMFLLSNALVGDLTTNHGGVYFDSWDRGREYLNVYQGSLLQQACMDFYNSSFMNYEKNLIIATDYTDDAIAVPYAEDPTNGMEFKAVDGILSGDKIFPLSVDEVLNANYGLSFEKRKCSFNGYDSVWWLRSQQDGWTTYAGAVDEDGLIITKYCPNDATLRPAMNLAFNPDRVLLTSSLTGKDTSLSDGLVAVNAYDGSDWKLTVIDTAMDTFSANAVSLQGDELLVWYQNAYTGTNWYISAIITDENGVVQYYGKLAAPTYSDDYCTINLKDKYKPGDKLYIFNEKAGGYYQTDVSSYPMEIDPYEGTTGFNIWVNDIMVTDQNNNDVLNDGGSVKYDFENHELIFNNPVLEHSHHQIISTDVAYGAFIYYSKSAWDTTPLTISGQMTVGRTDNMNDQDNFAALLVADNSDVIIKANIDSSFNDGILVHNGSVLVENSNLKIGGVQGLTSDRDIAIKKSTIEFGNMTNIKAGSNILIEDSDVDVTGNVEIIRAGATLTIRNSNVEAEGFGADNVDALYAGGHLTLEDENIDYPVGGYASNETYRGAVLTKDGKPSPTVKLSKVVVMPKISNIEQTSTGVKLTWNAVNGISKYRVLRKEQGQAKFSPLAKVSATTYTDKTAEAGKTYVYTVRALDVSGNYVGEYDAVGETFTLEASTAPQVVLTETKDGYVKVTWDAIPDAVKYRVLRKAEGETKFSPLAKVSSTSYTDKTVEAGKTYTYTVRCMDGAGVYFGDYDKAGKSITLSVKVAGPEVTVSNTDAGVLVTWTTVPDAAKYRVLRKAEGESAFTPLAKVSGTSYTDKNVESGKKYIYTVRPMNLEGKYFGEYDTVGKEIVYSKAQPEAVVSANWNSGIVVVTWNAVEGASKYRVMRKAQGDENWSLLAKTSGTTYKDKTAVEGVEYYYTVRLIDAEGNYFGTYNKDGVPAVSEK